MSDDDLLDDKIDSQIDDLEKINIDFKRIKKFDNTKKRAVTQSVLMSGLFFN